MKAFQHRLSCLPKPASAWDCWYVAYSGGLDSTVLLYFLSQQALPVQAIHVNHQLQTSSDQWAEHCAAQCKAWNIPYTIKKIQIDLKKGESIEAAAREARYSVFREMIGENTLLCTAHHQADQAETVLLQLLRGSGLAGLSAMPVLAPLGKGLLFRPFLSASKAELEAYAKENNLTWIEDPSNENTNFDRNYVRHRVMPVIKARWPSAEQTLARSAEHCANANQLLKSLAEQDLVLAKENDGLSVSRCLSLPEERQKQLLRYWIQNSGYPLPSTMQLENLCRQLRSREDSQLLIHWSGAVVRRYQDVLFLEPYQELPDLSDLILHWDAKASLELPYSLGRLEVSHTQGQGLSLARLEKSPLSIRFRGAAIRCHPVERSRSQTLKRLLQEYQIPPWKRSTMPLVYCGEDLACVPGAWICKGFEARAGEPSILIEKFPSL